VSWALFVANTYRPSYSQTALSHQVKSSDAIDMKTATVYEYRREEEWGGTEIAADRNWEK